MIERSYRGWPWRVCAILLGLIGLYLFGMGGHLVLVGGSPYYVLAGMMTIAAGVLVGLGNGRGGLIYALMLAATVPWALWEVGLDPWPLVARLVAPTVLGLPLLGHALWRRGGGRLVGVAAVMLVAAVTGTIMSVYEFRPGSPEPGFVPPAQAALADGDWTSFGRTNDGRRFAPFTQINQANVGQLKPVWSYRAGHKFGENTPLKVGDSLYLCTGDNVVIALDAETGAEKWTYDPKIAPNAYGRWCRAVAYHGPTAGAAVASDGGECVESIYVSTRDARLIALDAATGRTCSGFGRGGTVDLKQDMGGDAEGYLYSSSPALVIGDLVVVANCVYDGQSVNEPSGVVRAFNAKTGQFVWAFDAGRPGVTTQPAPGEHFTRGTPNVWSVMSADEKLGLIFLPTGNATPDYFGGHRKPILDKYAASTVALDARTGQVRWAFQTTHHDIWDYDVPSQPVLFDFPTPAGRVPAVLQPTKRGELFVLDRRTGKPITRVVEKRTPQGAAKGDYVTRTQPFSVGMPSLMDPDLTEADMWGMTPLDQLWCRVKFRKARYEGTMTPIGVHKPSLRYPGSSGIYNWGSISIDEDTGVMVAATLHLANYDQLIPRGTTEARAFDQRGANGHAEIGPGAGGPQRGTPYAVSNPPFFSPLAVPCTKPPFGRVSAIDLNTRKLLWSQPVGTTRKSGPFGLQLGLELPMGVPVSGGMLVTRGGVSFYGASQDGYLRAYATRSGTPLWRTKMPAGTESTPMSYVTPKSGRQMVVITVGGAVGSAESADYVIAFALPDKRK